MELADQCQDRDAAVRAKVEAIRAEMLAENIVADMAEAQMQRRNMMAMDSVVHRLEAVERGKIVRAATSSAMAA